MSADNTPELPNRVATYNFASEERGLIGQNLAQRIDISVVRRTPFMSAEAQRELVEDLVENIGAYLKAVFDL